MPNLKSQSGFIPLVALVIVGMVSASGVTVVASQKSIPGDVLYPVKKVVENVKVATAFSEKDKAKVHLAIAEEKVKEIEKLEEVGRVDKIVEATQNLQDSEIEALELTQVAKSKGQNTTELESFLQAQIDRQQIVLTKVSDQISEQARQAILEYLEQLREEFGSAIEVINEEDQEEASSTPCPSPSIEDADNKVYYQSGGFSQLRNATQYSSNPCDSNAEENSAASSQTFDGGAGSGDFEDDSTPPESPSDDGSNGSSDNYSDPQPQPSQSP